MKRLTAQLGGKDILLPGEDMDQRGVIDTYNWTYKGQVLSIDLDDYNGKWSFYICVRSILPRTEIRVESMDEYSAPEAALKDMVKFLKRLKWRPPHHGKETLTLPDLLVY